MLSVFQKYPEFITTDPRVFRTDAYSIDSDFMDNRHRAFFNFSVEGKTVLDLGSCVGATGAWVLENNASLYHGVELSLDLSNVSIGNLEKYFARNRWQIYNSSIENFLLENKNTYDIIIASGVLYSFFDPIPFLDKISKISNTIIIESLHPQNLPNNLKIDKFLEDYPLISFREDQAMSWDNKSIQYPASNPSLGFLKLHMKLLGFSYDQTCYDQLKINCSHLYNKDRRYAGRFNKLSQPTNTDFVNYV